MPGTNVRWPLPLVRQEPFYPAMMGVAGTGEERGLRASPTGTVFYVDPNFPGASDSRDGTEPTSPLLTVAAAVALCQGHRGDVIMVAANNDWYYADPSSGYTTAIEEEVTINVPGVRLVGVSQASTLGVMWSPVSNGGTCITVSAIDVTIEGFVFTEGNTYTGADGIYCEWDGATLFGENLTVRNCVFDDTIDTAIQLEYAWYNDIHSNWFLQCDEYGVYLDPAGSAAAYTSIHDNWFLDCDAALTLRGLEDSFIYNNYIYNGNAEGGAAATDEGIDTTGGNDNLIVGNYLSCLLPVPANGDLNDLNTAAATDAWVQNFTLNGPTTMNPT